MKSSFEHQGGNMCDKEVGDEEGGCLENEDEKDEAVHGCGLMRR